MKKKYVNETVFIFISSCSTAINNKCIKKIIWINAKKIGKIITTNHKNRAIIYWVYNTVMVLPSKKYVIDYNENSYR